MDGLPYSAGPLVLNTGRIIVNEYLDIPSNEVLTMVTILLSNATIFKDDNAFIYRAQKTQSWFEERQNMKRYLPGNWTVIESFNLFCGCSESIW